MFAGGPLLASAAAFLSLATREIGIGLTTLSVITGMYGTAWLIDKNGWGWTTVKMLRLPALPALLAALVGVGLLSSDLLHQECARPWTLEKAPHTILAVSIGSALVLQHAANSELSVFLRSTSKSLAIALGFGIPFFALLTTIRIFADPSFGVVFEDSNGAVNFMSEWNLIKDSVLIEIPARLFPKVNDLSTLTRVLGVWALLVGSAVCLFLSLIVSAVVAPEGSLLLQSNASLSFVYTAIALYSLDWTSLPSRRSEAGWIHLSGALLLALGTVCIIGEAGRHTLGFRHLSRFLGLGGGDSFRGLCLSGGRKSPGGGEPVCEICLRNDRDLFLSREQLQRLDIDGNLSAPNGGGGGGARFHQEQDEEVLLIDGDNSTRNNHNDNRNLHSFDQSPLSVTDHITIDFHSRQMLPNSDDDDDDDNSAYLRGPPLTERGYACEPSGGAATAVLGNYTPSNQRLNFTGPKSSPVDFSTSDRNFMIFKRSHDKEMVNECEEEGNGRLQANMYGGAV